MMKGFMSAVVALLLLCGMSVTESYAAKQTKPLKVQVWEKKAPHHSDDAEDEAWMEVYLPSSKSATGRAVIICPGGGYQHLAMDHEGRQWAPVFNNLGIAAIVLHYRMPHGDCRIPMEDAEQAFRIVRANAKEWNINPEDVGIMGSSAGGHLASTMATHMKTKELPAFQILFYPVITMDPGYTHKGSLENFLGKKPSKKNIQLYSNDEQVSDRTPRAWIGLSDDDAVVMPANGMNYAIELYRHDVPLSLHVYPTGGHGWGVREAFAFHSEMILELKAWLRSF